MTYCYVPPVFQQHLKVESEIWDLGGKIGTFWDHFGTLVPFGTKSRIRDLIIAPASCLPITLNKCLKRHKSLGSLSNVKSKSTASESAALDS